MNAMHQENIGFMEEYTGLPLTSADYIAAQQKALERISGNYLRDYLSNNDEKDFLRHIDCGDWITDLKRRVQHYGYRYDYQARKIATDMRIGDLPVWVELLADRVGKDFFGGRRPDQMIVNEYEPGQGIAPHVDCKPCFGPTVVSVSLSSTCVMTISQRATVMGNYAGKHAYAADAGIDHIDLFLERRSAVVFSDESRYHWAHGIAPRKNDRFGGQTYPRGRRISLTFRSVIVDGK